jgi:hypothetical protein
MRRFSFVLRKTRKKNVVGLNTTAATKVKPLTTLYMVTAVLSAEENAAPDSQRSSKMNSW